MRPLPSTQITDSGKEAVQANFKVDLSKHYKIWFSKNRENFLGYENQKRLKKMRKDSPNIQITFIYSASCLSPKAIERLKIFCKNNNITPVDFDNIDTTQMSDDEKQIYAIAKEEINKAKDNQGGNMAAASDCARFLIPIIEKYGIYSDFDVIVYDFFVKNTKPPSLEMLFLIVVYSMIEKNQSKHSDIYTFREYLDTLSFEEFEESFTDNHWDTFLEVQNLSDGFGLKQGGMNMLEHNWESVKQNIYKKTVELTTGPVNMVKYLKKKIKNYLKHKILTQTWMKMLHLHLGRNFHSHIMLP